MRSIETSLSDSLTALCTIDDPMNFGMASSMLHSRNWAGSLRRSQHNNFLKRGRHDISTATSYEENETPLCEIPSQMAAVQAEVENRWDGAEIGVHQETDETTR